MAMLLSIVIPCYNSTHTISDVVDLTQQVIDGIDDVSCEIILVNDGSPDGTTFDVIRSLAGKYPNVKGIDLARNFGQHNAIMAGLHEAEGDLVMGMDDDMQTHPSQIPIFLEKMKEGYDVVFGIYRERKFGAWKNLVSKVASNIIWKSVGRPKGLESSNFWCCRKYVIDEVIRDTGYNLYLEIMFFRTTNRIANVPIDHFERAQGTSNYTFRKGLKLCMSFINDTVLPLRLITYVGGISAVIGFISALIVMIRKILDPTIPVGWSSLMCVVLVMFGITFLGLGILGEYVGNMVINQNKQPQFVVRESVNLSPGASSDDPGSKIKQTQQHSL